MSLRLIIEDDEGSTTVVPLAAEAITIGRQQGNTIQLTEKNVSRQHARLFPDADGWVIEDLGSYNGIKVNNQTVDGRTKLREGDVVEIGDYHLAITEDVDKSPLNFRSGQAANDPAHAEPMLVSSSADLPRLSPEEIAALQSGQQPITPAPRMMVDSGPVPAGQYHGGGYGGQPQQKNNTGLFIFLGMVVLAIAALAIFWMMNNKEGGSEVAADTKGAAKAGAKTETPTPASADGGADAEAVADDAAAAEDDAGLEAAEDDAGLEAAEDDAGLEAAEDDAGLEAADDGEIIDDDGGDDGEFVEDPTPKPKPKPKPTGEKPKPQPTIDADAVLNEARKLVFSNPAGAFSKAKQAFNAKPSRDALWVMGNAACRLKDKAKATYVLKRLKGAEKTKLKDICAQKGLEL